MNASQPSTDEVKPATGKPPREKGLAGPGGWWSRSEQLAAGGVLLMGLAVLSAFWIWQWTLGKGLIEIDQSPSLPSDFRVDLNQADWPEISLLPGIGEGKARQIVEYRRKHGPFHSPSDLRKISGIGAKTLEKIEPYLAPLGEDQAAGS